MKQLKGKVAWFNSKLGYGFINNRNIRNDIYVHYSEVEVDGYKELFEDEIVSFYYDENKNKATRVKVIKKSFKRKQLN